MSLNTKISNIRKAIKRKVASSYVPSAEDLIKIESYAYRGVQDVRSHAALLGVKPDEYAAAVVTRDDILTAIDLGHARAHLDAAGVISDISNGHDNRRGAIARFGAARFILLTRYSYDESAASSADKRAATAKAQEMADKKMLMDLEKHDLLKKREGACAAGADDEQLWRDLLSAGE